MSDKIGVIGVIGVGVVGNAVFQGFQIKGHTNIYGYDKYKNIGCFGDMLECDIVFLCLPTFYSDEMKEYDKTEIHKCCKLLEENNYKGIVVIKSTVEPGTTQNLSNEYNLKIMHNPEFLSAVSNIVDFVEQKHIVLGKSQSTSESDVKKLHNIYKRYFPQATISECMSDESESMKIYVNSYYSVKVQFFNELYLLAEKTNIRYDVIRDLMLKNGWINPMHTNVPGPDGKLSYGGMCFPKDTNALHQHMLKNDTPGAVLKATIDERNSMRDD